MAIKPLNSVAGFSIGEYPTTTVVDANGNVTANTLTVSSTSNLGAIGNVNITGGTSGQAITTDGAGNLSFTTISSGSLSNGTSNIQVLNSSNITFSSAGTANVMVVTGTGVNVSGTLNSTGNANVGNIGTAQVLASANITSPQLISNVATGTSPLIVSSNTVVANLNANLLNGATTASANTASTIALRDANGNVSANFFIGNGSQLTGLSTASISNGNSNVNIPAANGNVNISAVGNANVLVVTGTGANITGTLNATGNANVGNIGAANGVFTTNVSVGSYLLTPATVDLVILPATGLTRNYANFDPYTGGYYLGGGVRWTGIRANSGDFATTLNVTGNANVGNLGTAQVLATANITSPQLISNIATGTAPFVVTSTTQVANLSVATAGSATSATTAGTVTTAAQPNITSVGTLTSLAVSGNITAGNIIGVFANGNSNVSIPAANGNVNISAAGNANIVVVTGTGANINGTANITGNANVGNLGTGGLIIATGNITSSANLISDNILGRTGALTITSAGTNTNINLKPNGTGNIDANSTNITSVKDPVQAQDAATKSYVDAAVTALHVHQSCNVATTTDLATATGGTITYNNGTLGVGATLTLSGSPTKNFTGSATFDTGYTASLNDRVLVKSQTSQLQNGIYVVTSSTVLTRATDADTSAELNGGDFTFVNSGGTYADTGWVQTTDAPTIGTSAIVWTQFSGAGTYTAGTGLALNGTQFYIANTAVTAGSYGNGDAVATFTVNGQGQLTAAANTAITANAANLTGTTLNSSIVTSSLTTVGTLGSLAVTGNTTSGNFVGVLANGNSNVNIPAVNGNVNISAVGTANVVVITATGINVAGTLNATGNANTGNIGAATGIFTTAANTPLVQNGTSNIGIVSGGTISMGVAGITRFSVTSTGANINGTGNITGNANVGNLGTAQVLATANITAPQLISNIATGTAPLVVTSTTQVANLNVATAGSATNAAAVQTNTSTSSTVYLAGVTSSSNGNSALNIVTGITANFASNTITATTFSGALANGTSNVSIPTASGNVNIVAGGTTTLVVTSTGANITGTLNTGTGNASFGNVTATNGNLTTANVSGNVILGNSTVTTAVSWASTTTTSITANQTIATFSVTGVVGVEFIVKGIDATGSKYSFSTVHAVTDGTNVDYSTFGGVTLGGYTGSFAVAVATGQLKLMVTPASTNSTVWTTQYRFV